MNRREMVKNLVVAGAASRMTLAAAEAAPQMLKAGSKARIKTAICAYSFRDALAKKIMSYEDLVDMAVEHRIDGLDLTVYWFPDNDLDRFLVSLRRKAYLAAVELPSIAIRTDMCQGNAENQRREAAWIRHWVDIADRLCASHIRIFGGNVPKDATEDQAAGWVAEILKRAADYAGSRGVFLGLENHGGITLMAKRIISIVQAVNHPWVGINLDTGNFRSDPYAQIEACLPYAVNSQFKVTVRYEDDRREACDWERIVKMFAAAGYRGYVALEYEEAEDPAVAVPRHLKTMRELCLKYSY
jgi:L-ribulose-5-phosphate 3-epimerase